MIKKIIFFLIPCILCFSVCGAAASLDTVFLNLGSVNCPEKTSLMVSGIVRGKIDAIKNCDLIPERSVLKTMERQGKSRYCYDRACAVMIGKDLKADRAIFGTVRIVAQTYNRQLGKEGAGKYLLQEKAVESYVITLYLVDIKKETVIASVTETAGISTVPRDTERISARLQHYFVSAGEARKEQQGKAEPALNHSWSLCAGPSGIIPLGSYRSMTNGGAGFAAGGGISNLGLRNSLLRIRMGYYYAFPKNKKIRTYHAIPLTLLIGYTFELPKGFAIAPLLGGGYIFHLLTEDTGRVRMPGYYRYSNHRFFDPHLMIQCETAWNITAHYAVTITPGYMVFFEKSRIGMAFDLTAGFRYTF